MTLSSVPKSVPAVELGRASPKVVQASVMITLLPPVTAAKVPQEFTRNSELASVFSQNVEPLNVEKPPQVFTDGIQKELPSPQALSAFANVFVPVQR